MSAWFRFFFLALAVLAAAPAVAQVPENGRGVGYPTVAAALEALKARSDVKISARDGWTIIEDPKERALWSFVPAGHPAYPAVVKRAVVVKADGMASIWTGALCQAEKTPCDRLMADFQALNERARDEVRRQTWRPTAEQDSRARALLARFQLALTEQRFADAYAMFTPMTKTMLSQEAFVTLEKQFVDRSGGGLAYKEPRITWYNDPPNAAAPGTYAAFDLACTARLINLCAEVVILHQQADGEFLVMRQERTAADRDAEQKLREQRGKGSSSM